MPEGVDAADQRLVGKVLVVGVEGGGEALAPQLQASLEDAVVRVVRCEHLGLLLLAAGLPSKLKGL